MVFIGDAVEKSIDEAEVGTFITIATRYWEWIENGTHDTRTQIRVYDENNERVEFISSTSNQITDLDGWLSWENAEVIDTQYWDPGTYTAEVLIRDNQNQEVSDPGTTTFELVQSGR